ncbi:Serpin B6 [Manis pentadactyla]|nr:Serpin B6 [Manis pentadactyla]
MTAGGEVFSPRAARKTFEECEYSYDHSMQKMNEVQDRIPDHKNINSWFGENRKGTCGSICDPAALCFLISKTFLRIEWRPQ